MFRRWNWESDDLTYPDFVGMVDKLRSDHNVRVLTYVNPFLVNASGKPGGYRRNLLQEAHDHGYLVKQQDGTDYMLVSGSFEFGTVDLANPAAASWYAQVIVDNMLLPGSGGKNNATGGVSGWMHDFGEYVHDNCFFFV